MSIQNWIVIPFDCFEGLSTNSATEKSSFSLLPLAYLASFIVTHSTPITRKSDKLTQFKFIAIFFNDNNIK